MKYRKYTESLLKEVVKDSCSFAEVARKLGVTYSSSYLINKIKLLKIDISHFKSSLIKNNPKIRKQNLRKNKTSDSTLEDYFSNKKSIYSYNLKERLFSTELKLKQCERCLISEWMDNPVPLELHHKDRNKFNNSFENLEILCPNCHSLEHKLNKVPRKPETKRRKRKKTKPLKVKSITRSVSVNNNFLRPDLRKVERPPYEILLNDLSEHSYCAVGRKYGVSDNAVRKWIKMYEKYT